MCERLKIGTLGHELPWNRVTAIILRYFTEFGSCIGADYV